MIKGSNVLALYLVPAFLYCLYNNLAFHNLSVFDPTTYFLLLQFRVVITGLKFVFNLLFKFLFEFIRRNSLSNYF